MKNIKIKLALTSMALLSLLPMQSAFAGFPDGCNVTMGGKAIFQMAANGGYSADHRAQMAQDALDNALVLASNRSESAVTVGRVNGAIVIQLDGRAIATVDANSASQENMTAEQLAEKWANSIKNFLSHPDQTASYLASLTGQNPVQGHVAIIERRLYAPAGLSFRIHFLKDLSPANFKSGDMVEAVVDSDVAMGNYFIPANSIVTGQVIQSGDDAYKLSFTTLRIPGGTDVAITAFASADSLVKAQGPHAVCNYAIPSGTVVGKQDIIGRVPANISVGSIGGRQSFMVLSRESSLLVANHPVTLVFEKSTSIAVVSRETL